MDTSTLCQAMAARVATAIQSEVSTHRANVIAVNATANQASLGTIWGAFRSTDFNKIIISYFHRLRCDQCAPYQYGFSAEGCKPCDCDESGSKGFQCDQYGQCPCNDNVEGRRCDRCKENKYDRHQGCLDCPDCYNLVQDAANDHRRKLNGLNEILQAIASNPTVIDDIEFESKLKTVQEKIDILAEDAKTGAGGGDRTLVEQINDLRERLDSVRDLLVDSDTLGEAASREIVTAGENVGNAEQTIQDARAELTVSFEMQKEK